MSLHLRLVKPSIPTSRDRAATFILREFGSTFAKTSGYQWLYRMLRYRLEHQKI